MAALSQLTPLLSSTPYLLAYTLPLLLISLLLTFAGTFLTLDRTRSFPSVNKGREKSYAALSTPGGHTSSEEKKRKFTWVFEGGLGGLAGGFAFGVHLSTALALLIPATSSASSLSPKSFLAVWVLICAVTTPLAARYRYAAFTFLGISGGTLFALAFCIIAHPSLPSRIILTGLLLPLFTMLLLLVAILPISRLTNSLLHPFLRICTATTGSFGIIISIALLMDPQEEGWANTWERLWMSNGPEGPDGRIWWGSSTEQGLSVGFAVFFFAGIAWDWALRKWFGECPDEKWDNYLAKYTASLPNLPNRAGTFQPHRSFLDRFFSGKAPKGEKDILFPNEVDMKAAFSDQHLPLPVTMHSLSRKGSDLTSIPAGTELLKKRRSKNVHGRKGRKPVKFGIGEPTDSSEDDTKKASSSGSPTSQYNGLKLPELNRGQTYRTNSSTPTLVDAPTGREGKRKEPSQDRDARPTTIDYEAEIAQLKEQLRGRASQAPNAGAGGDEFDLEYSDYEDEGSAQRGLLRRTSLATREAQPQEGWSPGFLRRLAEQEKDQDRDAPAHLPAPAPVPATPSLIKALDRLALAQREAYGAKTAPSPLRTQGASSAAAEAEADNEAPGDRRSPRWEEFWREVRVKAQT